jgi:hypothetical protein
MIFDDFLNIPRTRTRGDFPTNTRPRGFDKKIEPEDMGLPLTNASRLSEDNLPFNSDSTESIHPQLAKIKHRLTEGRLPDTGMP